MKQLEATVKTAVDGNFSLEAYIAGELSKNQDVWDTFDDIDDMEGIEPRLPQIDIAHSAQVFKLPDGSKKETITAIIIDHNRCNSYWKESFDKTGGGETPDCFSLDAYKPHPNSREIQAAKCKECQRNQFLADKKECKNMRRLHLIIEGSTLPHRLTLSPANLKGFDTFVTLEIRQRNLKLIGVLVTLGLTPVKSKSGIEYSQVTYSLVKANGEPVILATTKEQALSLKELRSQWLETMRGEDIILDEHVENEQRREEDAYDLTQYGQEKKKSTIEPKQAADGFDAVLLAFGKDSKEASDYLKARKEVNDDEVLTLIIKAQEETRNVKGGKPV